MCLAIAREASGACNAELKKGGLLTMASSLPAGVHLAKSVLQSVSRSGQGESEKLASASPQAFESISTAKISADGQRCARIRAISPDPDPMSAISFA